jgi:hypothetical protein
MLASLGYAGSGGLMAGLVAAFGVIPIIVLQNKGWIWRKGNDAE